MNPPVVPSWYCQRSQSRPDCADACAVTRAAVRSATFSGVMIYRPTTKLDEEPELVTRFGEFGEGPGQFIYPTDVAFDEQGHVFVSE